MRKLFVLVLLLSGCKASAPPVSLEETARKFQGEDFGLYFRDWMDGETLEISAEKSYLDRRARFLSVVHRVLEEVSAGRVSWRTVSPDLEKMLREGDGDAAVNLVSRFGRDAEHSISARQCARWVEGFFTEEKPTEIRRFLEDHERFLGRFRSPSGRLYSLYVVSFLPEKSSGPEKALHDYARTK